MTRTSNTWPSDAPDYTSLAAAVQGEAARWNAPGLTAAVLHQGKREATATGVTNLDHPAPITVDTRFQVGSITKVFTATTIMALVDQGKLDLDRPVSAWAPDLLLAREAGVKSLTLRHLLNHTTGFEGDVFFDTGNGDDALERGMARFATIHQWTIPGEVFAYCNTGFYLAGRIIEVVTGKTYEDVVTELLLNPLGLEQTCFPSADLINVPTASGHTLKKRKDGHKVYPTWALPRVVNAAGGVVSTVDDLLTFAGMHMNNGKLEDTRVISEESAKAMRQRTSKSGMLDAGFGIGWNIRHIGDVTVAGHGGATNGFRATLLTVPERHFALAMLSNGDPGSTAMASIQKWVLRHYLDLAFPERAVIDAGADVFDAITGHYKRHDAVIDVWREGDHIHVERRVIEHEDQFSTERSADDPPTTYDAWPTGDGVFRVMSGPYRDTLIEFFETRLFEPDGDDLTGARVLRAGGRLARRTGEAPASGPTTPA